MSCSTIRFGACERVMRENSSSENNVKVDPETESAFIHCLYFV